MHTLRTALRRTVLCVAALSVFWLVGNLAHAYRMPARDAALIIAHRYQNEASGSYAVRQVSSGVRPAWPALAVFVVSRDGQDCARVGLRDLVGLGWLEDTYERLD